MIYTLKLIRQAEGDLPDTKECRISQSTYLEIEKMFAAEFIFTNEIRKIRDEAAIGGE